VARVSALSIGLVYGSLKLKYLKTRVGGMSSRMLLLHVIRVHVHSLNGGTLSRRLKVINVRSDDVVLCASTEAQSRIGICDAVHGLIKWRLYEDTTSDYGIQLRTQRP
ncbi:hypothetical protein Tco_1227460, partial [Tanacetum coccineum]